MFSSSKYAALFNCTGRFFCCHQKTQETSYRGNIRGILDLGMCLTTKTHAAESIKVARILSPDCSAKVTRCVCAARKTAAISGLFALALEKSSRTKEYILINRLMQANSLYF